MQVSGSTGLPRFRQDLVAEVIEEQGTRFIDVMDPDTGSVFRFYEVEYALACGMDGERDIPGLVRWAQEELGLSTSPAEVATVIHTLGDLRFIASAQAEAAATQASAPVAARPAPVAPLAPPAQEALVDDELAPGVVVGKSVESPLPPSGDFELGVAGTSAPQMQPPSAAGPASTEFALGAPGVVASKVPPRPPVEDISLGAPGAAAPASARPAQSEVSIDLKDHLAINPSDVKEAVRASKVMSAVDVPAEHREELAAPAPVAAAAAVAAAPAKADQAAKADKADKADKAAAAAAVPVVAAKADKAAAPAKADKADKAAPAAKADKAAAPAKADKADKADKAAAPAKADKAARELPTAAKADKAVDKAPVEAARRQGPNPILVVVLILAVVFAGAFAVWKFVLNKPEPAAQTQAPPPVPVAPATVSAKVVLETPPAVEVKATAAGSVETAQPATTVVKAGDVIATLAGAAPLITEIAKLTTEIEGLQPAVDAAEKALSDEQQKENNQAGVTKAQAALDKAKTASEAKKAVLTQKQTDLDNLSIKATSDGTLSETVAAGAPVTLDQVVAKVTKPTAPTATFAVPAGIKLAQDGTLSVTAGGKPVVCTVTDAQASTVKVTCPADAGLAAGAELVFTLPKP